MVTRKQRYGMAWDDDGWRDEEGSPGNLSELFLVKEVRGILNIRSASWTIPGEGCTCTTENASDASFLVEVLQDVGDTRILSPRSRLTLHLSGV
jgi:hypothetical protein